MQDKKYDIFFKCLSKISLYENTKNNDISKEDYIDSIHYVGLFYNYLYEKGDKEELIKNFYDKYFQYFFLKELLPSQKIIQEIKDISNKMVLEN